MNEGSNTAIEELVKPPTKTGIVRGGFPSSSPEAVRGETRVRFLNIRHGVEHVEQVWGMVKDADIIYIERVGGGKFLRSVYERVLNLAASNRSSIFDPFRNQFQEFHEVIDTWSSKIAAKAIKAGKSIRFIDVSEGGSGFKEVNQAVKKDEQFSKLINEGDATGAFAVFQSFVDDMVVSTSQRDEYTLKQLREEIERGRIGNGRKIVIIQGALHSAVYHKFKNLFPEVKTEREFPEMPFRYGLIYSLIRSRIFHPDKNISQEDYLRACLDAIIQPSLKMLVPETSRVSRISLSLVRSLDLNELRSSLTRYGELFKEYHDRVFRQQQVDTLPITVSKLPISAETLTSPQKPLIVANTGAALARELLGKKGMLEEIPSEIANEGKVI